MLNLFVSQIFFDIRVSFNVGLEVSALQPTCHSVALYPFVSVLTQYTFGNQSNQQVLAENQTAGFVHVGNHCIEDIPAACR